MKQIRSLSDYTTRPEALVESLNKYIQYNGFEILDLKVDSVQTDRSSHKTIVTAIYENNGKEPIYDIRSDWKYDHICLRCNTIISEEFPDHVCGKIENHLCSRCGYNYEGRKRMFRTGDICCAVCWGDVMFD